MATPEKIVAVDVKHRDTNLSESSTIDSTEDLVHVSPTSKRDWRSYVWDTFDKSPEERRFLFKLDAVVITLASLGYFIKYLDQININNAFVSGMKTDLALYGDQLNLMQTCWTVGYVLGEIPSNMILTRIRPSIWIPAMELTWSILTILLSQCRTAEQVYALRFFVGLAESTFYPGMQYIIGSWYRKDELAKRSCIFHASSAIGTMFSGYLMAAVYHLDGVNGYKGWQWLFIVNGIISMPIATVGFFMFPDYPHSTRAWWLTAKDRAIGQRRMQLEGRSAIGEHSTLSSLFSPQKLKKIFTSWHIYLLSLLYIFFNNGNGILSQPGFQLWLQSLGYSVIDVNTYPTLAPAVQIVTTLLYAWTSDGIFKGARWPPIMFSGTLMVIVYSSLAAYDIPIGWHWACLILAGAGGGISGLCFAWAHEICADDTEERAFVTGTMNEMAYVFQAWLPLLIWKQTDAPRYFKGTLTMVPFNLGMMITALTIRHLHRREQSKKLRQAESVTTDEEHPSVST
ncbi:hypothetical protein AMS68_004178 [Peltaster fructicola]|uniref:Major facilitator superfamily (MFS) profile domain-containing protein n=1 Tax=Peltaster fructicola TaxID=286661 RepID=A0A6H0XVH6_9PEZI|nr:hypothetical protein AMS68_004178 [Peltaster fructicola]